MLDRLIRFVLRQRLLVILAALVLVGAGLAAWRALPVDAFPDVTGVQVMVLTEAPGLAPVDVEQRLTYPIELSFQGLPRVREVRSMSKSGLSQVIALFEDGVDIYFARQLVFERLQSARESLPEWARPEMGPISTGLGEIYQYTVEGDGRTPMELRTIQDWQIAPQLRALAGVNEVNSFGGLVRQYHALIDPPALLKYGLALGAVLEAIERNNATAGGDFIVRGWEQAYVRSDGMIRTAEDIGEIVLKARDGTPVRLRDVARIEVGPQTRQGAVTRDGRREAVAGMAILLRGENSKIVVDRVKKAIPAIENSLPKGVRIVPFYDRTSLIQACIRTVSQALLQGGLLVIAVLFLFLGNLRAALIVAVSLPLTAFAAFLLMGWRGVTANLMSLGGLAIALGMVVDASIVVSENVLRHLTARAGPGADRGAIVYEAVREVARPVVFSALIILVVFAPLFTLQEMEGKMFKPLALTMGFAMLGSLVVAMTVVPVLSSLWLRPARGGGENLALRLTRPAYLRLLDATLRHRLVTLAAAVALLAAALAFVPRLGTEFLPSLDEGALAVNVVRLPSASLEGSVAVGTVIERQLLKHPEVETVVTKTGRAEISEDPMGPEQSDFVVVLKPPSAWPRGRTKAALVEDLQREFAAVPGIRASFSQPIALRVNELISGIKSDLAIKIFGSNLDRLRALAERVAGVLGGVPGAEDVKVEQISGFAQIEIVPDRRAIARHEINVADINDLIETAVGGRVATEVIEDRVRTAVLVRFPEEYRGSPEALGRLLVPTPAGASVPLGQLAAIREVEAPAQISRENAMRRVVVECNIRGRDIGGFVREARRALAEVEADRPEGTYLRYGGQFENQERAMRRLSVVVPVSIGLIFVMLFSALGTVRSALMVLANLPFALVGGIAILLALGIPVSVSTAVGFITLFGIAVGNGVVLVSFFNQLVAEGRSPEDAVREGCALRFRPLMMTTLTTLLGLLPMIYATGSGSELQRPLAAVVLGGMATALALTLIVLPALYVTVETRARRRA